MSRHNDATIGRPDAADAKSREARMTQNQSATTLPITNVVAEALWCCWRAHRELWKVLVLPALFLIAIATLNTWVEGTRSLIVALLYNLLNLIVFSFAAVSCHRLILLGPGSVPAFGVSGKHKREWQFIARALVLSIGTTIAFAILASLAANATAMFPVTASITKETVSTLSWSVILLLASPFSLTLPACAVDAPMTFRQAWRMSRGDRWRLALLISGLPWLIRLGEWAIATLFDAYSDQRFVSLLLFLLILPVEISLLSVCYRRLRDERDEECIDPAKDG
jgi:hypothetical protein